MKVKFLRYFQGRHQAAGSVSPLALEDGGASAPLKNCPAVNLDGIFLPQLQTKEGATVPYLIHLLSEFYNGPPGFETAPREVSIARGAEQILPSGTVLLKNRLPPTYF